MNQPRRLWYRRKVRLGCSLLLGVGLLTLCVAAYRGQLSPVGLVRWWSLVLARSTPSGDLHTQRLAHFRTAQERWRAHAPAHYRLVLARDSIEFATCRQTLDVRGVQVSVVEQTACEVVDDAPSVAALFTIVGRYTTEQVCGPNGCTCDGRIVADAVYDPHLGFPQRIHIWLDEAQRTPWPWWTRIQAYWDSSALGCTGVGFVEQTIRIEALTPLP